MSATDAFDANRAVIDRLMLSEGPELVLLVDVAAAQILSARGAGDRVLGCANDSLAGKPLGALVPAGALARELVPFEPSMVESAGTFGEVAVAAGDGPRVVSVRVQTFPGEGGGELALVRLLDVSAQHHLSSELRTMHQQLQQAFRTLREQERSLSEARRAASLSIFAAGLAHELNNPIAAIVADASILGMNVDRLKDAAAEGKVADADTLKDLAEIAVEVGTVSRRVSAIVTFLKELEIVPRAGKLEAVGTIKSLLTKWPGVTLKGPDRLELSSDAGLFKRALEKLLDNARRASGPKGAVTVELLADGQQVIINVDDVGPGVDVKLHERVFDPFFSMRPPGEGLGLGLFLARRAAHRLGGDVTLETRGEPGARFRLTVPVTMPTAAAETRSYEDFRSGKT